ncbi:MAG TPA: hypothetical protein GX505_01385 [Clostridiales bacterium]|nr:hypothetical protein [Clostridiales bacterium]
MECSNCKTINNEGQQICSNCGCFLSNQVQSLPSSSTTSSSSDTSSDKVGFLGILLFCIPIIGVIMYFVWHDEFPKKARKAIYLALWGFGATVLSMILSSMQKFK